MGSNNSTEYIQLVDTGISRPVDELGRIVLPVELRRTLDIHEKDLLEIHVAGNEIVLRKQKTTCVFCGSSDNIISWKGRPFCRDCATNIKDIIEMV